MPRFSVDEEVPETVRAMLENVLRRDLAAGRIEGDPTLLAQGWDRRFVAEGARAAELSQLYESLGYDVLCKPIRPEQIGGSCAGCQAAILASFCLIYTRRNGERPEGEAP
jgi:hypothetical protein